MEIPATFFEVNKRNFNLTISFIKFLYKAPLVNFLPAFGKLRPLLGSFISIVFSSHSSVVSIVSVPLIAVLSGFWHSISIVSGSN